MPFMHAIPTHRLELTAATIDHIFAEMESSERLAQLLGTQVESGWPPGEYDRDAQEFFACRLKEGGASVVGWYVWYAVQREKENQTSILVGAGGYFGPPNEAGEVEMGFSIMPSVRGDGYATEMTRALVSNAFRDIRVNKVIARTTSENIASVKVLMKSGFSCVCRDQSGNDVFEILRNGG